MEELRDYIADFIKLHPHLEEEAKTLYFTAQDEIEYADAPVPVAVRICKESLARLLGQHV